MLNYKKVDILGFDYTIEDLFGHATLFIHSNPYENRRLYKNILILNMELIVVDILN